MASSGAGHRGSGALARHPPAPVEDVVEDLHRVLCLLLGLGQDAAPELDRSGVVMVGEESRPGMMNELSPIVSYCNELLKYAVEIRASDMHLEPRGDGLLPRYRIDGQLRAFGAPIAAEYQLPLISRLKVLANLDITETRLPQDGRFRAIIGGRTFDFRVSTLPSIRGEKVVYHSSVGTRLPAKLAGAYLEFDRHWATLS